MLTEDEAITLVQTEVIPREGVESVRNTSSPSFGQTVIPREGVERKREARRPEGYRARDPERGS